LSPVFFTSGFVYASRRAHEKRCESKLKGTYQFLVHPNGINVFGGNVRNITTDTEALT